MALTDKVTARYSAQRMVELTNPDVPGAVALNAVRLAAAAADASGDFMRIVGLAYDDDNAAHVSPAVRRAHALLLRYMDPAGAFTQQEIDGSEQDMKDLRERLGAGARFTPVTDSVLTPSLPDTSSGDPVRPDFDPENYGDYQVGPTSRDQDS